MSVFLSPFVEYEETIVQKPGAQLVLLYRIVYAFKSTNFMLVTFLLSS